MLAAWFDHDLSPESALDRCFLGLLRARDRHRVAGRRGAFLWIHAVKDSGGSAP